MLLPITLSFASAAALINLWLSTRVVRLRFARKVLMGDGGDPAVEARMRAHANFAEYAPIVLILCGLVEFAGGSGTVLRVLAIVFVVGRIAHAFGMDRPAPNPWRAGGMAATVAVTLVLAGWALTLPYLSGAIQQP